jgi:hypothetical protein
MLADRLAGIRERKPMSPVPCAASPELLSLFADLYDEEKIAALLASGAPIDAFGVGIETSRRGTRQRSTSPTS